MNVEGACSTSGNRALHTRLTERMLPATSGVQASSGADCCVRHCAERGRRNACSVHKGNISAQQTSSMLLPGEEAAPAHPPRADACRTTHVHGPYYARMHDGRTDAARVARRETTSAPLACLLPSSQSPPHFVSVALAARHGGRWAAAVGPGRTRLSSAAPLAAERPAGLAPVLRAAGEQRGGFQALPRRQGEGAYHGACWRHPVAQSARPHCAPAASLRSGPKCATSRWQPWTRRWCVLGAGGATVAALLNRGATQMDIIEREKNRQWKARPCARHTHAGRARAHASGLFVAAAVLTASTAPAPRAWSSFLRRTSSPPPSWRLWAQSWRATRCISGLVSTGLMFAGADQQIQRGLSRRPLLWRQRVH